MTVKEYLKESKKIAQYVLHNSVDPAAEFESKTYELAKHNERLLHLWEKHFSYLNAIYQREKDKIEMEKYW